LSLRHAFLNVTLCKLVHEGNLVPIRRFCKKSYLYKYCGINCVETKLRAGDRGSIPGRHSDGLFFSLRHRARPVLRPIQPPIQLVPRDITPGIKLPGSETDHSLPYSAEVKNAWSYTSTPQYTFMTWCLTGYVFTAWCFVKYKDNFTFHLYGLWSRPI
jgi:hypothetical protein